MNVYSTIILFIVGQSSRESNDLVIMFMPSIVMVVQQCCNVDMSKWVQYNGE